MRVFHLFGLLLAFLIACDPGQGGTEHDAGTPGAHRLEIADPPGAEIGLFTGGQVTLAVRYLDPDGAPVAGAEIGFSIDGEAGGATLASFGSVTGPDGVAEVVLTAGAENANFDVVVSAPDAIDVHYEVAVSDAGFTSVEVFPYYTGERDPGASVQVATQLYFNTRCAELSPTSDITPDRVRDATGFETLSVFQNLPVDQSHSVAVLARNETGAPFAWGCADIDSSQLVQGVTVRLQLAAEDTFPSVHGEYRLESTVVLGDMLPAEIDAAFSQLADLGDCPYDPIERIVDCLIDVVAPDGALDCVPQSTDPLAGAIEDLRGVPDPTGCRSGLDLLGLPSLEAQLLETVDATGVAHFQALADLAAHEHDSLRQMRLVSRLQVEPGGVPGTHLVSHRLREIEFPTYAPGFVLPLIDLGSPLLGVPPLPAGYEEGDPAQMEVPLHALQLQGVAAAREIAYRLHLAPAGLPRELDALGRVLLDGFDDAAGQTGCHALASLVCTAMGDTPSCLAQACPAVADLLAVTLQAPWDDLLVPSAPDLTVDGWLLVLDDDADLVADRLSGEGPNASFNVSVLIGSNWITPLSVELSATREPSIFSPPH